MVTRREREREETRQHIIEAARRLFVAEGYERVTIRRIADEIEYTPGAIYFYFADKDAIFHAIHQQGFDELLRRMGAATLEVTSRAGTPLDQARAIARAYLDFARDNPDLYDLMFVAASPLKVDPARWPEGQRAFDVVRGVIKLAIDGGWIGPGDPDTIAFALWSACHGMVTLNHRGRCAIITEGGKDIDAMITASFEHLLGALTHGARRRNHS